MSTENDHGIAALTGSGSRRAALHAGGALFAGIGTLTFWRGSAAQATPTVGSLGEGLLVVQSFSQASLFPTQGDPGVVPYTVTLWDAADRGLFFADWATGRAGVVPIESVLAAMNGETVSARAVLVAAPAAESGAIGSGEQAWALSLVNGSLGSDPGAVTYQGEQLGSEAAMTWLGSAPADLPDGPQGLGPGFLIFAGLSGFDTSDDAGVRLAMT